MTKALILQLKREVEARQARLVVVILTNRQQVHDALWQETLETYPAMRNIDWDMDKPDKIMAEFLEEYDIPYLRLAPAFRSYAASTNKRLHFHYDGHWTAEGHRLAGQLIHDYLLKQKLIPSDLEVRSASEGEQE